MNRLLSIVMRAARAAARIAPARWARNGLVAAGLMAALSSPAFAQYVFGQSTITVPASVAGGTVVARDYLTPSQLCYGTTCTLTYIEMYKYGGAERVPGPDVLTTVTGLSTRLIINGQTMMAGPSTVSFSRPIEIQLVSNGTKVVGGPLKANGATLSPAYYILYFSNGNTKYQIFLAATVQTIDGTCSTPSQAVTLPPIALGKLGAVGSSAGGVDFNVRLNNCPAGFNRVGYSFVPVGSETSAYTGVLPLGADSTATGVRIRITDANGTPATFNQSIKLNAYSKTTGGSYAVPYKATYIKTADPVTVGSVKGSVMVLVDYQ
ncbi:MULTISPECIES: fimbrial protein [Cupriavidus]|uniref:fimbrial protein n=1 Tax=Cupriavidus TaxID=106589 RepID=UPI0003A92F07|nr:MULTISPECIES: fimbrial protein [Cupriavidus]